MCGWAAALQRPTHPASSCPRSPGQTGSGKTYTITGGTARYADRGLIPRALAAAFAEMAARPTHNYSVHCSYLEVYNEVGYDLLGGVAAAAGGGSGAAACEPSSLAAAAAALAAAVVGGGAGRRGGGGGLEDLPRVRRFSN